MLTKDLWCGHATVATGSLGAVAETERMSNPGGRGSAREGSAGGVRGSAHGTPQIVVIVYTSTRRAEYGYTHGDHSES